MILTKAEVDKLRRDVVGPNWIRRCANAKDVDNFCDTIDAMRAALEAWVEWTRFDFLEGLDEQESEQWQNAVALTKAAGIEIEEGGVSV